MAEDRIVVKVQVPLDGDGPVLIYNEDRSISELFEGDAMLAETRKELQGKPKGYFYAHIGVAGDDKGMIILDAPAPCQTW